MKGREAARAAKRLYHETANQLTELKADMSALEKKYEEKIAELRLQNRFLRENIREEAANMAANELVRLTAEKEEEHDLRVAAEERIEDLVWRKDVLVYSACRYLSMSLGIDVTQALGMVVTWMLDADYEDPITVQRLIEQGLPHDGWACTYARVGKQMIKAFHGHLRSGDNAMFIELGKVEKLYPDMIHRLYIADQYAAKPDFRKRRLVGYPKSKFPV